MRFRLVSSSARFGDTTAVRVLLLAAALGFGCASPVFPGGETPPQTAAGVKSDLYRVGASDQLTIRVLPDPAIERTVIVRPDGYFSLDLIGDVEAAGKTPAEIATDVENRMQEFRQSPSASVSLEGPMSNAVAVLGEVNSPTLFPLDRDTRVSEAIARAGGATNLAAASRVRIIRKSASGTEEVLYLANLDNIQGGISQTDMLLQRGDMVFVPPAATVEAGYALRRFLFPFEQLMRTVVGPLLGFALR
jgi:polysaccharide export outer membrane protein